MIRGRLAVLAVGAAALLVGACAGGLEVTSTEAVDSTTEPAPTTTTVQPAISSPSTPSTVPPTTSTLIPADVIGNEFLAEQASKSWDSSRPGAVMVVVFDSDGRSVHASLGTDPSGSSPTPADAFRIGSITKLFTAVAVLALVDDGLVDLDASLSEYVTRVDVDDRVTVRDALQHTSGLPDYTEVSGFDSLLYEDFSRVWLPEEVVAIAPVDELDFQPGDGFGYSNTNYTVLGILLEEVTETPYHEVVRERIIDPLSLTGTFLAGFEEGPEVFGGYEDFLGTTVPIDYDFTSIATNAWAGGAMVSTGGDLHTLVSALFAGEIISTDLVTQMTANAEYGFGLYSPEWKSETPLFGHDGRIPGAGTFLLHSPKTGMTAFTVSNSNHLKVSPATADVAKLIGVPGARLELGG